VPNDLSITDAEEALIAAVTSLGLVARPVSALSDHGVDLLIEAPDRPAIAVEVKTMSLVNTEAAQRLRNQASHSPTSGPRVIVASRITSAARNLLNESGLSWLDLRGHLRLVAPGIFVDTAVAALSEPAPERRGVIGQVGMELATLLLMQPWKPWGVREAAEALSRAPSSVSQAFSAMRAAQLVSDALEPEGPELFWELARHWSSTSADVASLPGPGHGRDNEVLRLGFDRVEGTTGWALSDTVAAAYYGAPVAMRADHPLDFYVPDRSTLRRAVHLLGPAPSAAQRAGQVRIAPVPAVCNRRIDGADWSTEWPLAHPLFVALDLAQDPGRGREILRDWDPTEPVQRVW
jgi:hypothetical protein